MGRKYEYGEWLQFECEGVEIPDALEKLGEKFGERAIEVVNTYLHSQFGPQTPTYNDEAMIWNTYASIVGHGVGLWEKDGDTGLDGELEGKLDAIVKQDKKLRKLADQIQMACEDLHYANKGDGGREHAADFPSKDAAVRGAQSHGATHVALRPTHVFAFNPTGDGYAKRELFFARGKLHWPSASVHVKTLPVDAIAIEHALGRQAAETPRGEGPLQAEERDYPFYIYVELDGETVFVGTARGANRTDARMDFLRKHPTFERRGKLIAVPDVPGAREDDPEGSEPLQAEAAIPTKRQLQIIEAFRERRPLGTRDDAISTTGDTIYSYRMPIAQRNPDGSIWIENEHAAPSATTRNHIYGLQRTLTQEELRGKVRAAETQQGGEPLAAEEARETIEVLDDWGLIPNTKTMRGRRFSDCKYVLTSDILEVNGRPYKLARGQKTQQRLKKGDVIRTQNSVYRLGVFTFDFPEGAREAPRVGGPSPSEARESTAVPAEDAVPWVRITRDPEQYAEGMKRAKEIGPINSGKEIYELLAPALSVENQEVFLVVLCNLRQECLGVAEVHRGERSRVSVSRADILQVVTKSGADHFHVVHNHPSGDPTPSEADRKLTDAIMSGGDNVDIPCVDHVVIGMGKYYSFAKGKVVTVK